MKIAVLITFTFVGLASASAYDEFESRQDDEIKQLRRMMRSAETGEERTQIKERLRELRKDDKQRRRGEMRESRRNGRYGDADKYVDRKLEREKVQNMTPEEHREYRRGRRKRSRAREF